MSKTAMRQTPLWKVVPAAAKPVTYLGRELPGLAEWVRLLVGRSLAFAQPGANGETEYLVLGIPLGAAALESDDAANRRVKDSLNADFEVLKVALQKHSEIISSKGSLLGPPETFLRAYGVLASLRLPEELADWHVTDEGLTIVNWGLESGKPFLDWKPEQLEVKRSQLIQQIDKHLPPSKVAGTSSGRDGSEESAEFERSLEKTLQDPLPSGVSKVKLSAPEPGPGGSQPTRPEPEPPKGLRAWFSHPAMTVSIQVVAALMLAATGFMIGQTVVSRSAAETAAADGALRDQAQLDKGRFEKLAERAMDVQMPCNVDPIVGVPNLTSVKSDVQSALHDFDTQSSELTKQWEEIQGQLRDARDSAAADDKVLQEQLAALNAAFVDWKKIPPASGDEKGGKVGGSAPDGKIPSSAKPSRSLERSAVELLEAQKKLVDQIDKLIAKRLKSPPQVVSGSDGVPASQPAIVPSGSQPSASGLKSLAGQQGVIGEALRAPRQSLNRVLLDLSRVIEHTETETAEIKQCMDLRRKEVQDLHDAVKELSAAADSDRSKPEALRSPPSKSSTSPNPPATTKQTPKDASADREAAGVTASGGAAGTATRSATDPKGDSKKDGLK